MNLVNHYNYIICLITNNSIHDSLSFNISLNNVVKDSEIPVSMCLQHTHARTHTTHAPHTHTRTHAHTVSYFQLIILIRLLTRNWMFNQFLNVLDTHIIGVKTHRHDRLVFNCARYTRTDVRIIVADINECDSTPCSNGATCTEGVDSYTCTCTSGYAGTKCTKGKSL